MMMMMVMILKGQTHIENSFIQNLWPLFVWHENDDSEKLVATKTKKKESSSRSNIKSKVKLICKYYNNCLDVT